TLKQFIYSRLEDPNANRKKAEQEKFANIVFECNGPLFFRSLQGFCIKIQTVKQTAEGQHIQWEYQSCDEGRIGSAFGIYEREHAVHKHRNEQHINERYEDGYFEQGNIHRYSCR